MKRALLAIVACACVATPAAHARDPGKWVLTGASAVPGNYWQGLTSDPAKRRVFFTGVFEGLWRTTPSLRQTAGVGAAIPADVKALVGYNHIGDPTWNRGDGGRVLLPLECYTPGAGNTCGTGAFGVADPNSLAWRYYVKLDPTEIPKAMWAETSPDGKLVWTSSGNDLLAYRSSDIVAGASAPIRTARRLERAVPPTGVTGAVFKRGRLLLAGEKDGTYQVWAVDPSSGKRRLEIEMKVCGESEGLDVIRSLGGELHWLIAPSDPGCTLTFGPGSALLHFAPRSGAQRLRVRILGVKAAALPGTVEARVKVTRRGSAVPDARVSFAGATVRTGRRGTATISTRLETSGWFKAVARQGNAYGLSELAEVSP
ncbi:MAG: hypothetical protein QOD13_3084 [Thermoleophilaceae bacterium]|nr:hypothetical protein [Thermoleophilaceae bacterium]